MTFEEDDLVVYEYSETRFLTKMYKQGYCDALWASDIAVLSGKRGLNSGWELEKLAYKNRDITIIENLGQIDMTEFKKLRPQYFI